MKLNPYDCLGTVPLARNRPLFELFYLYLRAKRRTVRSIKNDALSQSQVVSPNTLSSLAVEIASSKHRSPLHAEFGNSRKQLDLVLMRIHPERELQSAEASGHWGVFHRPISAE